MRTSRWSIVRLIWARELRDQLRDRRTMMMILLLPLLIYPLAGTALQQLALGAMTEDHKVGIVGAEYLPPTSPRAGNSNVASILPWLTLIQPQPMTGLCGAERVAGAIALSRMNRQLEKFPPLIEEERGAPVFLRHHLLIPTDRQTLRIKLLTTPPKEALARRDVDVILVIPRGFVPTMKIGKFPVVTVLSRQDDESSRRARHRLMAVLLKWQEQLKEAKYAQRMLPERFGIPFLIYQPSAKGNKSDAAVDLFDLMIRIFPIILVMWSLAGALYPAVDLCAGEKERGTMETLLISPAQREEIVMGKFLAIWVFSGATALLNLLSMAVTAWKFSGPESLFSGGSLTLSGVLWCTLLILPLSAFFSAVCLSVGAYARSTKEGQYYLMPLFLVAMPLVLVTMAPGIKLSPLTSLIPVTGVSLLLQELLLATTLEEVPWLYFVPILAPIMLYSWLALRWAIEQFKREEVLFREAERFDTRLWLRRLLREKEPRPSSGQALFCFCLILGLTWFSLGLGQSFLVGQIIRYLAFVATPTLVMALMLTTQARESLALRIPPWWSWPVAVLLVLLLLPPLAQITIWILRQFPVIYQLIEENPAVSGWLRTIPASESDPTWRPWLALFVFAWLPAFCEELAFRGFILTGLQRRFRPRTAVVLSSFLFALFHMNVFQLIPTFLLGLTLAYLTTRCGSILPSMLFHMLYNSIILVPALFPAVVSPEAGLGRAFGGDQVLLTLSLVCAPIAIGVLLWMTRHQPHPAYVAFLHSDPALKKDDQTM